MLPLENTFAIEWLVISGQIQVAWRLFASYSLAKVMNLLTISGNKSNL
jgi:hypothetical protein